MSFRKVQMKVTGRLLAQVVASLALACAFAPAKAEARSADGGAAVLTQAEHRVLNGDMVGSTVKHHHRHARVHHKRRHVSVCGVFEPSPAGYCPNYTGPLYHRSGIGSSGAYDYAEVIQVPRSFSRHGYWEPRYHQVGFSYGWPAAVDNRRVLEGYRAFAR